MLPIILIGIFAIPFSNSFPEIETSKSDSIAISNENSDDDLKFLLNNVKDIYLTGWPGVLSVYGPSAFPILVGETGSGIHLPIGAGSRFGKGKLLGLASDDFLDPENSSIISNKNDFLLNSIHWVTENPNPTVAVINSTYKTSHGAINFLTNHSLPTTLISATELTSSEKLAKYNVVLVQDFFNSSLAPILTEYAENGGGLIIALTSWAYFYFMKIPGHFGTNFPANMISNKVGFLWHDDGIYDLTSRRYNASIESIRNIKVLDAWKEIKRAINSGYPEDTRKKLVQYSSILDYGFQGIPRDSSFWSTDFYEDALNYTKTVGQPVPSKEDPVKSDIEKFELQIFYALSSAILKPEDMPAHPAGLIFPGDVETSRSKDEYDNRSPLDGHLTQSSIEDYSEVTLTFKKPSWFSEFARSMKDPWEYVPNSENVCHGEENTHANLTTRSLRKIKSEDLEISNKRPLWFSTGLYARPGQVIRVNTNSDESMDSYGIQIGSHTDDISSFTEWPRAPKITFSSNFVNNSVSIASPYGGLIYVVVPEKEIPEKEKTISMTISGSTRAPHFKLGVTQKREWKNKIRNEPGPWTEFETNNIILTVPSASIREMEDPEDLLLFWDQVMDAIADLAAIPRERYRPERMVPDVQISIGFMHSGYPIMTLLNEGNDAVNLTLLRKKGSWGHFHELGHNHQISDWTFDGTTEVTCNLFALYVMNTIIGIPTEETRRELTPKVYKAVVLDYIVSGLDFEKWKSDPFLALMFYVQLQREYGWTAYKQVFAKYRELTDHPSSEQQKIDLWLAMFSSVVKQNLSPFFQSWGFPISDGASQAVSEYPDTSLSITDLLSGGCHV